MTDGEILWRPTPAQVAAANLTRFRRMAQDRSGEELPDHAALHAWSIRRPAQFWELMADFAGVRFSKPATRIKGPDRMPGTKWFTGARLNLAENLLATDSEKTAIIYRDETGANRSLSYSELSDSVASVAAALRARGVKRGDRVAGLLVNGPETVIAALATIAVGAAWTACSPDFGEEAAVERLGQVSPKVVFVSDCYYYGGRRFDCAATAEALARVKSVKTVVTVPYDAASQSAALAGGISWAELTSATAGARPRYAQVPFDQPAYIMYSSGTTGLPKAIVHGAGGTLLQHRKEHLLHADLKPHDVVFYGTTCSWMMWHWLISVLAEGAAIVLYEGSMGHPDLGVLWQLAADFKVTVFGTSASFIEACIREGINPASRFELNAIRAVLSTGSPLSPEGFRWVYRNVGSDLLLGSISGGTDIISCFVLSNPTLPVRAGRIQGPGLGMNVAALNAAGRPVVSQRGELACLNPTPSMPVSFWEDPSGRAYRDAYFGRVPGVWCHGDYIEIAADGSSVIYGRSDATLNPRGIRIGTAEIYRPLERIAWISDAIAAGYERAGEENVALFLVCDGPLDEDRMAQVRSTIARVATPRHVPAWISRVLAVPVTRNGKKAELAVKARLAGRRLGNETALANPECLNAFTIGSDSAGA